jgi:hypothetical protein
MVGEELLTKKCKGKILLLGGAVMILVVGNRNSTRDIDASFEDNPSALREAASHIADREGLPSNWLNDGAKGCHRYPEEIPSCTVSDCTPPIYC